MGVSRRVQGELVGVNDDEDPPVPIPNTVVKLISAENTWMETSRENRSMPTFDIGLLNQSYRYSSIAQLVEHAAVNRRVVGSSPTWGAILKCCHIFGSISFFAVFML